MVCKNCHQNTSRVRIIKGIERCSHCGGFSEANGNGDGALSRQRVRGEAVKYEGDTINPWKYDKTSKKFEPNDDFIKRHAVNAMNFFTPKDLKAYPKLKDKLHTRVNETPETQHIGKYEPAMHDLIKSL